MKRRDFLTRSIGAGLFTGISVSAGSMVKTADVGIGGGSPLPFDLVAVMGGEPDVMFDRAIQSLGGIGAFVKKGQTVVVKPNIGWDSTPEKAANTNPLLVKHIVKQCLAAGAKRVYVFDHTCDSWKKCYASSGIEAAVKEAGGEMVSADSEGNYHSIKIPRGKKLQEAKEHELILSSDVFINVPVLKNHNGAQLTVAMKNLMGIVWDRGNWHRTDLHQSIADFATYRNPTLNVVDAYRVMKTHGPRGISVNDTVLMKSLLVSPDMVAVDTAAAKMFGMDPAHINYLRYAQEMGVGTMNLESLRINRIKINA